MRAWLSVFVLLAFLTPATADSVDDAKKHYAQGRTFYDLGQFTEAAEEFKKAYELMPDAAFLYNIAQSYRLAGDAKSAVFFYKRYLKIKPDAKNRADVEKKIEELGHRPVRPGELIKRVCADEEGMDALITACKAAHKKQPKPRYLYNIGWAYQQKGDLREAVAYFQKYLADAPTAGNRVAVEHMIAELEARLSGEK